MAYVSIGCQEVLLVSLQWRYMFVYISQWIFYEIFMQRVFSYDTSLLPTMEIHSGGDGEKGGMTFVLD